MKVRCFKELLLYDRQTRKQLDLRVLTSNLCFKWKCSCILKQEKNTDYYETRQLAPEY